jgi:hypothetical protein
MERRQTWTAMDWRNEAIVQKDAAKTWASAGRHDKAGQCRAEADCAEHMAKIAREARLG